MCCFEFVGVFFWWYLISVKKTPTQPINAAIQHCKGTTEGTAELYSGRRISKCDFFQEKKKVHKTVQMLLLAEVIGKVQCSLTMALKLGLVHTGRGLVIVLWAEEPPGCPHEPPAHPV